MLKKSARLSAKEASNIQKNGKKRSTKHFFLSYTESDERSSFGVGAPKGGEITGVDRNRLRRKVYTYIRKEVLPSCKKGVQGMVGVRKGAYQLPYTAMEAELDTLFSSVVTK